MSQEPTEEEIKLFDACRLHITGKKSSKGYHELETLIENGIEVWKIVDSNRNELLHVACQADSKRIAKLLLRERADINAQNKSGNTPLHYCYQYNHLALGEYLESKNASKSRKNLRGLLPSEGIVPRGELVVPQDCLAGSTLAGSSHSVVSYDQDNQGRESLELPPLELSPLEKGWAEVMHQR